MQAPLKPLLKALKGESGNAVPIWLMRQAGRYLPEYRELRSRAGGFLELCFDPALAAEATLQPLRRFGLDAAIIFSDILVIPHALGRKVGFASGEGPFVEPLADEASVERLRRDRLHEELAPIYEVIDRVAGLLPHGTSLIGFAGAPWTVASYMVEGGTARDFAVIKGWAYRNPEAFERLLAVLVEATAAYLVRQVEHGAEVLQIFESWAGALAEREFQQWSIEPVKGIVARVRKSCPDVPIIGFPRGAGYGCLRFAGETAVNGIGLDPSIPLAWAAHEMQHRCTLQGNLDPVLLLVGGEPMKREAVRILSVWGKGPFIFNLGHGVLPTTPPEHVAALVEIVRNWQCDPADAAQSQT
ncbi:MAG TPA: uroporphyrinogen decarboxylase [Alphaproteobacteria bacterium]|nr:uroporphyrinogen decarboxylase [Alphaproteobacteria bacterium]